MKMKNGGILTAVLLIGFLVPAFSQEWTTDYPKAVEQAKAQNKVILLDFTGSDWCGWCQKMKEETLDTPEFKQYAEKNLVLVELDFPKMKQQTAAEKKQNETLSAKFNVHGFPTFVLVGPNGKELGRQGGYFEGGPTAFISELNTFYKPASTTQGANAGEASDKPLQNTSQTLASGSTNAPQTGGSVNTGSALNASAGGQFGPSSDILGMNLNMSPSEIRQVAERSFVVSEYQEKKSQLTTDDFSSPEIVTQITFGITSKAEQKANAEKEAEAKKIRDARIKDGLGQVVVSEQDNPSSDVISIALSPSSGTKDVISIARGRKYAKEDRPLASVLLAGFAEKYGPFSFQRQTGEYIWSDSYKTEIERGRTRAPEIFDWLPHYFQYKLTDYDLPAFVNQVRNVRKTTDQLYGNDGKCGMSLCLITYVTPDGYVDQFSVILTNEEKAITAGKLYADDFWKTVEQAKKARLEKDAQKKPQL